MATAVFFYTGIYDNVADTDADYEAIESLHRDKAIGSYDSAIVVHTPDGDVKVTKTKKPTHVRKREVGDWDEAEQEALSAIERAEAAPVS